MAKVARFGVLALKRLVGVSVKLLLSLSNETDMASNP